MHNVRLSPVFKQQHVAMDPTAQFQILQALGVDNAAMVPQAQRVAWLGVCTVVDVEPEGEETGKK